MIFKRLEVSSDFSTDLRECYVWKCKKSKADCGKITASLPANQAADDARTC